MSLFQISIFLVEPHIPLPWQDVRHLRMLMPVDGRPSSLLCTVVKVRDTCTRYCSTPTVEVLGTGTVADMHIFTQFFVRRWMMRTKAWV